MMFSLSIVFQLSKKDWQMEKYCISMQKLETPIMDFLTF